jgi:hypothetical protein
MKTTALIATKMAAGIGYKDYSLSLRIVGSYVHWSMVEEGSGEPVDNGKMLLDDWQHWVKYAVQTSEGERK